MDREQFTQRTKELGLRVIKLVEALPDNETGRIIAKQLLRSATSVGANYRAACRGRSTREKIAKFKIVEEEADETLYWLELITEAGLIPEIRIKALMAETNEIIAMTVASLKTLKARLKRERAAQA